MPETLDGGSREAEQELTPAQRVPDGNGSVEENHGAAASRERQSSDQ
jgi:hypothetical protein